MALVHKSKKDNEAARNGRPFEKLGIDFVTVRHTQLRHAVESGTADERLGALGLDQTGRKFAAKDGFQTKHGRLG